MCARRPYFHDVRAAEKVFSEESESLKGTHPKLAPIEHPDISADVAVGK